MANKKLKVNRNRYDFGGGVGNIPADLLNYSQRQQEGSNDYMNQIVNPEAQVQQGLMNYEIDKAARENSDLSKALGTIGNLAINAGIGIMTQGIASKIKGIGSKAAADATKADSAPANGAAVSTPVFPLRKNGKPKRDYTEVKKGLADFGMNFGKNMLSGIASLFAEGGVAGEEQNVEHVPIEAEGGEMIAMPWDNQAMPIEGASHENGGVDMTVPVGSKIYSKRVKDAKGKSMAYRKERRDRELKKWEKIVNDDPNNKIAKDTLEKVRRNNEIEEANDMAYMQLHKAKKQFSDYIKDVTKGYGKGGGLNIAMARQAIDQEANTTVQGQHMGVEQYAEGAYVTNNIFEIAKSIKDPNIRLKALQLLTMINNANPNNLPTNKSELINLINNSQATRALTNQSNNTAFPSQLYVSKLTGDTIYNDQQRQALAQKYKQQQSNNNTPLSDPTKTGFGLFKSYANPNAKSQFPTYEELQKGTGGLFDASTYGGTTTPSNAVVPTVTKQQVTTTNTNTVPAKRPVGVYSVDKNSNTITPLTIPQSNLLDVYGWLGVPSPNQDTVANNVQPKVPVTNTKQVATTNGTVDNPANVTVPISNSNSFGVLKSDMNKVSPSTTQLSVNGGNLLANWEGVNLDGGQHGNGRGNLSKEQLGKDIQAVNKIIYDRNSMPYARGFFDPNSQTRRPEDNTISAYNGNPVTQSYMNIVNSDPLYEEHYIPKGTIKAVQEGAGTFIPGLGQLGSEHFVPLTPNNAGTPATTIIPTGTVPLIPAQQDIDNTGLGGNTNVGNGIFVQPTVVGNGVNTPITVGGYTAVEAGGNNTVQIPAGTSYINGDKIDYKALTSDRDKFVGLTRNIAESVFRKANSIGANDNLTGNREVGVLQNKIITAINVAKSNGLTVPQLREKLAKVLSKEEVFNGQTYGKSKPLTDAVDTIMSSLAGTGLKQDNTKGGNVAKQVSGRVDATDSNNKKPEVSSLKFNKDGTVNQKSLEEFNKKLEEQHQDNKKQVDSLNEDDTDKKGNTKQGNNEEEKDSTEKPSLWSVLGSSLDPAFGMQLAGILHNMVKPKKTAEDNFKAKQRYKNNYRDYGKKSLLELDKMKDNLQAMMDQNIRELESHRAAQTYINNNSARDINVARALNLAALSKTMDATNRVYANQAALQNNIHQTRANMLSNIDHRVMGEDRNTQTLNNQLIDSYFNNKATADMIFGTGLQNIGKLFDNREFIKQLKNMYKERTKGLNSKSKNNKTSKGTPILDKTKTAVNKAQQAKPKTNGAVPN